MKRPISSALSVVDDLLREQTSGRTLPTFEDVVEVVRSFQRIGFEVSPGADSDGFLFQYGVVNWLAEPLFDVAQESA